MPSVAIRSPGLDDHDVAAIELGRRHGLLTAAAEHRGGVRYQGQQGAQAATSAGDRVLLEALTDGEQEREHGGLADLAEQHRTDGGDRHQGADPDLALGQPLERGRDERVAGDDQRGHLEAHSQSIRSAGHADDQGRDQQNTGRYGGPDLGDLPQLFGFVFLLALGSGVRRGRIRTRRSCRHPPVPVSVP